MKDRHSTRHSGSHTQSLRHTTHIRLKSVPTSCIQHTANTLKQEPIDIYKHLYVRGNDRLFDLTENCGKCGFKFERDMSVRSYEANEFTRCITFPSDNERITVI